VPNSSRVRPIQLRQDSRPELTPPLPCISARRRRRVVNPDRLELYKYAKSFPWKP
jgi:hypothetical protein